MHDINSYLVLLTSDSLYLLHLQVLKKHNKFDNFSFLKFSQIAYLKFKSFQRNISSNKVVQFVNNIPEPMIFFNLFE